MIHEIGLVEIFGICQKKDNPQILIILIQYYMYSRNIFINKNDV